MDRFRAPDASDEKARCQGQCQRRMHYALLVDGYCEDCRNDEDEDNDMTEKEMRALDSFCAGQVMEWNAVRSIHDLNSKKDFCVSGIERYCWIVKYGNNIEKFSPTTDPAAAMQVLEKCAEFQENGVFKNANGNWQIRSVKGGETIIKEADTLPLAICLFAQKLFTHETKT